MSVDFAAIADRAVAIIGSADPAQFQAAYDTMVAETTTQDRELIPGSEALDIILNNRAEWLALTDIERETVRDIITVQGGIPTTAGSVSRTVMLAIYGAGTTTRSELAAAIPENVPTWPGLTTGQVQDALNGRVRGDW